MFENPQRLFYFCLVLISAHGFAGPGDGPPPPQENPGMADNSVLYLKDGGSFFNIPVPDRFDMQGSPVFSNNGKKIAYDAWSVARGETFRVCQMVVSNLDGTEPVVLGIGTMPSFSGDGSKVAFCDYQKGVLMMDIDDPKNPTLIDRSGWCARWSPDGETIAYTKRMREGHNMMLYQVATGKSKPLLVGEHASRYSTVWWQFSWSHDSKNLCLKGAVARPEDHRYEVAVVDATGSDNGFQVAFKGETGGQISFDREGKNLFATVKSRKRVEKINIETGEAEPLSGLPANQYQTDPVWHPELDLLLLKCRPIIRKKKPIQ